MSPVTVPGRASNVNTGYRIAHDNCVAPAQRHESEYYVDSPITGRIRYGITIDRQWMRMLNRVVHGVRPRKVADSAHEAFAASLVVLSVSDIL